MFELSLSVGSLAMIDQPVTDADDVENGIIGFVFSFLVMVSVWLSYTRLISEKKIETTKDLRLNLALLMLVAIEPYLLYLPGQSNPAILDFSSTAYAIDIGAMVLIIAGPYSKNVSPGTFEDVGDREVSHRLRYSTVRLIFLVSASCSSGSRHLFSASTSGSWSGCPPSCPEPSRDGSTEGKGQISTIQMAVRHSPGIVSLSRRSEP